MIMNMMTMTTTIGMAMITTDKVSGKRADSLLK